MEKFHINPIFLWHKIPLPQKALLIINDKQKRLHYNEN